jgi:hypothetical protein
MRPRLVDEPEAVSVIKQQEEGIMSCWANFNTDLDPIPRPQRGAIGRPGWGERVPRDAGRRVSEQDSRVPKMCMA